MEKEGCGGCLVLIAIVAALWGLGQSSANGWFLAVITGFVGVALLVTASQEKKIFFSEVDENIKKKGYNPDDFSELSNMKILIDETNRMFVQATNKDVHIIPFLHLVSAEIVMKNNEAIEAPLVFWTYEKKVLVTEIIASFSFRNPANGKLDYFSIQTFSENLGQGIDFNDSQVQNGLAQANDWINTFNQLHSYALADVEQKKTSEMNNALETNYEGKSNVVLTPTAQLNIPTFADKLRELHQLKEEGILTEEEYQRQKQVVLNSSI